MNAVSVEARHVHDGDARSLGPGMVAHAFFNAVVVVIVVALL